jgi:hypothetical protein
MLRKDQTLEQMNLKGRKKEESKEEAMVHDDGGGHPTGKKNVEGRNGIKDEKSDDSSQIQNIKKEIGPNSLLQ